MMKAGVLSKGGTLVVVALGLALGGYALHKASQPAASVESLLRAANEESSYRMLEVALESADYKERLAAVQALLALRTDKAFEMLRKASGDPSTVVRVAIVEHLAEFPEEKALPLILKLLDDREFGIARDAIAALQKQIGSNYDFRFEASPEERAAIIARCKRDITERRKQSPYPP